MSEPGFVHLHNHSDYSLLDGAQTVGRMVDSARAFGMSALALTDHGNMFGAVDFYDHARKAGLKPIIGMEAYVTRGGRTDKTVKHGPTNPLYHLVLLAATPEGYRNLIRLSSAGFLEGFYYKPRIDYEILEKHAAGLVALSGCLNGEVPRLLLAGRAEDAQAAAGRFTDIFGKGRFFLEIQDHGIPEEQTVMPLLVEMSKRSGVPLVATNDCHYNRKEDAEAHDVLVCIQTGKNVEDTNRLHFTSSELYFKSAAEMRQLFHHYPGACDRTLEIAEMCGAELELGKIQMPLFPCPEGFENLEIYLRHLAREGLARRYAEVNEALLQRLDFELGVICQMGYAGYFLVVRDFIEYSRGRGIPVGPGRGSAAGSLVAYCLGITDIDPIRFNLLFERFLNPERISMPDIDVDFEDERRDEIIQYVRRKYGDENVCQIITFGTMAARGAIRDVGRALGMTYGDVDRIAKLVPDELGITLEKAIETVPELREMNGAADLNGRLLKTARTLEGLSRHASTHAAGVIISPRRLDEIVPLFKPANKDEISTQYDMNAVEKIGLVKMDFLGLRTLKVIDKAVKLIKETTGEEISPTVLAFDDEPTMELMRQARTVGVFQFESEGMRNLLRRLCPGSFEDLVAVCALYRPGPMGSGMVDDFIDCKQGRKAIRYEHPLLEEILKPTYGMMVYQEQVMQIASKLAGFSLGQADLLRRAMGKKKPEEMAKQKEIFVSGAVERGIQKPVAEKIFEQMAYFAGYGFNKSHSAAYTLISYQTAWLKAHYPVQFMAASLTSEMEKTNRIVVLVEECRRMGIPVLPPDVNASGLDFRVEGSSIRFGLGAVKNVGQAAIDAIVAARAADPAAGRIGGPFTSLFDFCRRVDLKSLNRRMVESLVAAGAFDSLAGHRAQKTAAIPRAMDGGEAEQSERERGQFNLFGGGGAGEAGAAAPAKLVEPELPAAPEWDRATLLREEKAVLGFYLTDHPLATLREEIAAVATVDSQSILDKSDQDEVVFVGAISAIKKTATRSGDLMAWLTLEDFAGSVECLCFPDLHETVKEILTADRIVVVEGRASTREDDGIVKIVATTLGDFEEARASLHHTLHLSLTPENSGQPTLLRVREILSRYPGRGAVVFHLDGPAGRLRIRAGRGFRVAVSGGLLAELRALLGNDRVRLAEARHRPPAARPAGDAGWRNRVRRPPVSAGDVQSRAAHNLRGDPRKGRS